MRRIIAVAIGMYALPLFASLSGCANPTPDQQARIMRALVVACDVDGAVVPLAQPVLTVLAPDAANSASVGMTVLHPAVVAACQQIGGAPAGVTPVTAPSSAQTDAAVPEQTTGRGG
jgi:hypothetical protein